MQTTTPPSMPSRSHVLVIGAGGFLGGFVVAALRRAGHRVRCAVRQTNANAEDVVCDVGRMTSHGQWLPLLGDIDAVVNVAGILRETAAQRFEPIHHDGPLALAHACVQSGVSRFVQISALGDPEDGDFIASKHRFDAALLALPIHAVVLRPSVVYSAAGSYGGTSLLRALAATPGVLMLPGDGAWRLQPLAAEDLGELVVRALAGDARGVFEVGGPEPVTLRDYLRAWRRWLRLPDPIELHTPTALVDLAVTAMERVGRGPMGESTWRMLKRGNVTAADAGSRLHAHFGFAPRGLKDVLAQQPSQVQDRWQAQLYLLAPFLRFAVVALFLVSAWSGWVTPAADIERMVEGSLLVHAEPVLLARFAASCDLLLAIALLAGWQVRHTLTLMLLLVSAYTIAFGILLPMQWLDPLGGLAKNLVVLPALAALWVMAERR